jgi:hypothetical membrane protein
MNYTLQTATTASTVVFLLTVTCSALVSWSYDHLRSFPCDISFTGARAPECYVLFTGLTITSLLATPLLTAATIHPIQWYIARLAQVGLLGVGLFPGETQPFLHMVAAVTTFLSLLCFLCIGIAYRVHKAPLDKSVPIRICAALGIYALRIVVSVVYLAYQISLTFDPAKTTLNDLRRVAEDFLLRRPTWTLQVYGLVQWCVVYNIAVAVRDLAFANTTEKPKRKT